MVTLRTSSRTFSNDRLGSSLKYSWRVKAVAPSWLAGTVASSKWPWRACGVGVSIGVGAGVSVAVGLGVAVGAIVTVGVGVGIGADVDAVV